MSCSRPCSGRSGVRSLRKIGRPAKLIMLNAAGFSSGGDGGQCSLPRGEGMPGQPACASSHAAHTPGRLGSRRADRAGGRTSARFVAVVIAPAPLAICRQRAQESGKQQTPSTSGVRLVNFHQSGCQARQAVPRSQCCCPTYLWAWGRGRSGGAGSTSCCCPRSSRYSTLQAASWAVRVWPAVGEPAALVRDCRSELMLLLLTPCSVNLALLASNGRNRWA